ncbi:cell wall hydrolase [Halalkalibacter sp. AB-rgal2]|uniref:cell wall hydrolase n=1 Tax=Halalkalibacter sp. AB-rgal2 TaxID=3242695 RepID=UPI00359EF37F
MRKTILVIALLLVSVFHWPQTTFAFSEQIVQRGATGDDVVELQARLQYIGFYDGTIDGVYGWGTYWSVRNYQDQFGMTVDGLVGPQMKERLEKTTQYHEEFVQKALTEGREFTHYGTTPLDIQKGPKGSTGQKQTQTPQKEEKPQQRTGEAEADQPEEATPSPQEAEEPAPSPPDQEPPAQQEEPAGEEAAPTEEPIPEEQPIPEEPVPYEEVPEEQDNEANIQKADNVPPGYSDNDIQIMAQAVYGEARGEPYIGQVAVAAVIINRVNSPIFPNTVSGVIFEPRAFTAVADGQIYMDPDETARRAVLDALNGQDPTGNAIYYFNPDTATSGWIWSRPQIKRIGKHIFCH